MWRDDGLITDVSLSLNPTVPATDVPPVSPGYEGVPEFFSDLLNHISSVLQSHVSTPEPPPAGESPKGLSTAAAATPPWMVEGDAGLKGARHQRLGCSSPMSPSFQQHCVSSIATKASSQ